MQELSKEHVMLGTSTVGAIANPNCFNLHHIIDGQVMLYHL
jgi:hypothetical protein